LTICKLCTNSLYLCKPKASPEPLLSPQHPHQKSAHLAKVEFMRALCRTRRRRRRRWRQCSTVGNSAQHPATPSRVPRLPLSLLDTMPWSPGPLHLSGNINKNTRPPPSPPCSTVSLSAHPRPPHIVQGDATPLPPLPKQSSTKITETNASAARARVTPLATRERQSTLVRQPSSRHASTHCLATRHAFVRRVQNAYALDQRRTITLAAVVEHFLAENKSGSKRPSLTAPPQATTRTPLPDHRRTSPCPYPYLSHHWSPDHDELSAPHGSPPLAI